ncbi:MAG: hypothetical protein SVZ03_06445 [Spirochaetota bacterium]|nr:hypothetical protein [Spirochaetota bacterium]
MNSLRLNLVFIIIFIFSPRYLVFPKTNKVKIDSHFSSLAILEFSKYLISKEEYYRAYVELLRLNSYYPGHIDNSIFYTTELFLLFKGNDFNTLLHKRYASENRSIDYIEVIFKSDVYLERSEYLKANSILLSSYQLKSKTTLDIYIYKRLFLSYLLLDRVIAARRLLDETENVESGICTEKYEELVKYSIIKHHELKNPIYSSILGLIPGMGYVYSGRKPTGIIALLLVSVFSTLTYLSFKTDNKAIGIIVGTAGTFFYTGSIIGGFLSSKRYNREITNRMKTRLFKEMSLLQDRENIYKGHGIYNIR